MSKKLIHITEQSEIPLMGCIHFGIIDRGSTLLQIRPTSVCNLKCIFCSTNANNPKFHPNEFIVEVPYLIKWLKYITKEKDCNEIEANIDSVGDPLTHPKLLDLIKEISKIKQVNRISMQTNGTLLTKQLVKKLEPHLNQINLSINSLNSSLSKQLAGTTTYNLNHILEIANFIAKQTKIKLLLAPVWLPNINDQEIEKIIKLAKQLNCKIGIQKYETYSHSRKPKKVKKLNYYKFYRKLSEWEKQYNIKLKMGPTDFNIKKCKSLPLVFKKNETVKAIIKAPGWLPNQQIAITKSRCITVNKSNLSINSKVNLKILQNKNNIYLAKLL